MDKPHDQQGMYSPPPPGSSQSSSSFPDPNQRQQPAYPSNFVSIISEADQVLIIINSCIMLKIIFLSHQLSFSLKYLAFSQNCQDVLN